MLTVGSVLANDPDMRAPSSSAGPSSFFSHVDANNVVQFAPVLDSLDVMGVELVLNGANINLVAFGSKYLRPETLGLDGS